MTGEQNVQGLFQGCIPTKPAKYVQLVSFLSKITVLRLHGTLGYERCVSKLNDQLKTSSPIPTQINTITYII